jgi:hypothetical protein
MSPLEFSLRLGCQTNGWLFTPRANLKSSGKGSLWAFGCSSFKAGPPHFPDVRVLPAFLVGD